MKKISLLLFCSWFFAFPAFAIPANPIYSAEVAVTSHSAAEQDRAFPEGLKEVLIKVSGNRAVVSDPVIQQNLSNARNMVRAYHYVDLKLQIQFDPHAVNALLKKAKLSILSKARPLTLLWLAETVGQDTALIGSETTGGLPGLIQAQAHRRNLPVVLPALDLDDLNHLAAKDVIAFQKPLIDKASERYRCEGIWAGHLFQEGDHWTAKWTYWRDHDQYSTSWTVTGNIPSQVIAESFDKLADEVGMHLTQSREASNRKKQTLIEVNNLDSVEAYAKVLVYLRGLSPVTKVAVANVESSTVTFALSMSADQQTLEDVIALDSVLLPTNESKDGLHYRWAS